MDMLEQREALAEAKQSKDLEAVRRLAAAIEERARAVERALAAGFARGEASRRSSARSASCGFTGASSTR